MEGPLNIPLLCQNHALLCSTNSVLLLLCEVVLKYIFCSFSANEVLKKGCRNCGDAAGSSFIPPMQFPHSQSLCWDISLAHTLLYIQLETALFLAAATPLSRSPRSGLATKATFLSLCSAAEIGIPPPPPPLHFICPFGVEGERASPSIWYCTLHSSDHLFVTRGLEIQPLLIEESSPVLYAAGKVAIV